MKRRILNQLEKADKQENKRSFIIYGMKSTGKTYSVLDYVKENYEEYLYVDVKHDEAFINALTAYLGIDPETELIESKTGAFSHPEHSEGSDISLQFFSEFFKIDTEYLVNIPIILDNIPVWMPEYGVFDGYTGALKLFIITDTESHARWYEEALGVNDSTYHMLPMDFGEFLTATDHEWYDEVISGHISNKRKIPDMIHEEITDLFELYKVLGGCPEIVEEYLRQGSTENIRQRQEMLKNAILFGTINECPDKQISAKIQNVWDAMEHILLKDNHKFMYSVIRDGATKQMYAPAIDYMCEKGLAYRVSDEKDSFRLYAGDFGLYEVKREEKTMESLLIQNITSNGTKVSYWESGQGANVSIIAEIYGQKIPVEMKQDGKSNIRSVKSYMKLNKTDAYISMGEENIKCIENEIHIPDYAAYKVGNIKI